LVGGSLTAHWVANARRWTSSAWRSSLTFAETAQPRPQRAGWLESSLAMSSLFESGSGKTPKDS
jgi:hypothetical protein